MSHRNLPLRRAVATTLALSCALAATNSWAQAPAESSTTFGEIIVTAQKREQSLQDVPVVVTAVSAQLLHDTGVKDIKDLTVLTPGLLVTSSSSEASTTARIRGVGTVGDNPGLESSVGVVIDGVYRPRNGVGFGDLGEMERIEVLKGPQGTLFGKNTTAGIINVVSKKPTFDPSATVEVTGGNLGAFDVSSSVNGPLFGDKMAGRLFAAIRSRDGLLDVETAGGPRQERDDGNRDFFTVRGQVLYNFTDTINARFIADVTERDEYCCTAVQVNYGSAGVRALVDAVAPGSGVAPVVDPYRRLAYSNRASTNLTKEKGLSVELNGEIFESSLTSITALRDWKSVRGQDSDFTTADFLYRNDDGNVYTQFRQISEEVRLAGSAGPLNWLAGVFYAKEKLNLGDSLRPGAQLAPYMSLTATGGATAAVLPAWGVTSPFGGGSIDSYQQDSESFSVFTNDSFEIVDGLELTVGARYTTETKDLTSYYWNADSTARTACGQIRNSIVNSATQISLGQAPTIPTAAWAALAGYGCLSSYDPNYDSLTTQESLDESKFTGTGKLAYRFSEIVMSYVSYARGYKASGFNLDRQRQPNPSTTLNPVPALAASLRNILPVPSTDKSFLPETVDSFEVGAKITLLDNALLVNVAAFSQTYDNFQYNTFTGVQFEVRTLTEVQSTGIDADVLVRTPFGLGVQAGVTYSHTDVTVPGEASAGLFSDIRESSRMPFAPVWSSSLALTYKTTFGDYSFGGNIGAKYNSEYNTGSNLDPRKIQDAYTLVNARLAFGAADEKWTVELWGQNITDEEYAQVMFDATFQGSSSTRNSAGAVVAPTSTINAFLGAQRLYGASVILKF